MLERRWVAPHISGMEQSKVAGVLSTKVSLREKPSSRVPQHSRCHTPAVGTMQLHGVGRRKGWGFYGEGRLRRRVPGRRRAKGARAERN